MVHPKNFKKICCPTFYLQQQNVHVNHSKNFEVKTKEIRLKLRKN